MLVVVLRSSFGTLRFTTLQEVLAILSLSGPVCSSTAYSGLVFPCPSGPVLPSAAAAPLKQLLASLSLAAKFHPKQIGGSRRSFALLRACGEGRRPFCLRWACLWVWPLATGLGVALKL